MLATTFPNLSNLTKEVLFHLLTQALVDTHDAHDLIWLYTTKYAEGSPLEEIQTLLSWLREREEEERPAIRPILCTTSGKILARTDGQHVYLWCRRHDCWEPRGIHEFS